MTEAHLLPFIPRAARIDPTQDRRLARVAELIAESSSTHAAATWLMEHEPWQFLAVDYPGMDAFSREFMPYHPPRSEQVSERDFENYREVVVGAYRFHDMLLDRLLQLAGPQTTVVLVSGYGFHSDHLRPRIASLSLAENESLWRRPQGLLVIKGTRTRQDEQLYGGAEILDIAPTILALHGTPIPIDWCGRPLVDAFAEPFEFEHSETVISTREIAEDSTIGGASPTMRQLANRGLIPATDDDVDRPARLAEREQRYNLARSMLDSRKEAHAAVTLDQLVAEAPGDVRFVVHLAMARFAQRDIAECKRLIEGSVDAKELPIAGYLRGLVYAAEGDQLAALDALMNVRQLAPSLPRLQSEIGKLYLRLQRWKLAESAFREELKNNDRDADAHYGLSFACLEQRRPDEAARAARKAIGRRYDFPEAHYQLGVALLQLGRPMEAAQAFERCLALKPQFAEARRRLVAILEGRNHVDC